MSLPKDAQDKLIKLLMLTRSENDHEALSAIRMANAILAKHKIDWTKVIGLSGGNVFDELFGPFKPPKGPDKADVADWVKWGHRVREEEEKRQRDKPQDMLDLNLLLEIIEMCRRKAGTSGTSGKKRWAKETKAFYEQHGYFSEEMVEIIRNMHTELSLFF